jgi:hypothetical protein
MDAKGASGTRATLYRRRSCAGPVLASSFPCLGLGTKDDAIPTSLDGKKYVDLTGGDIDTKIAG